MVKKMTVILLPLLYMAVIWLQSSYPITVVKEWILIWL